MPTTADAAPRHFNTTDAAKQLRAELRAAFPGIRFSVRKSTGTACWWLNVTYTDGPRIDRVEAITCRYPHTARSQSTGRREPRGPLLLTLPGDTDPVPTSFDVDGVIVSREIGFAGTQTVAAAISKVAPGLDVLTDTGAFTEEILDDEQAGRLTGRGFATSAHRTVAMIARLMHQSTDLSASA